MNIVEIGLYLNGRLHSRTVAKVGDELCVRGES
jgi:hypothetical protein